MIEKLGNVGFNNVKPLSTNERSQRVSFAGESDKVELSTSAKEEKKSPVNKNWLYALGALALAVGGYFIFRGRNGDDLAKAGQKAANDLNPKPKPEPNIETKTPKTEPKPSSEPAPAAENLKAESKPATETKPTQEAPKTEPKATKNAAADYNKAVSSEVKQISDGGTLELFYNKDGKIIKRIKKDKNGNITNQRTTEYNVNGEKIKITYNEKSGAILENFYENDVATRKTEKWTDGMYDELTRIGDDIYEGVRTYPDGKKVKIREENLKTIELGPVE